MRNLMLNCAVALVLSGCGGGGGNNEPTPDLAVPAADMTTTTAPDLFCPPITCGSLGYLCGTINDGCGNFVSCGDCDNDKTCGGGGQPYVCGCTPHQCAFGACGMVDDGCGTMLDCGMTCTGGSTCGGGGTPNLCGCTPDPHLCDGKQCGDVLSACGTMVSCGGCAVTQVCGTQTPNQCGTGKHVFVTKEFIVGNFAYSYIPIDEGSVGYDWAGIVLDGRCENAAVAAGFDKSIQWKAWISTGWKSALDRIADVGPWYATGTSALVFENHAQLASVPSAPFNHDQFGAVLNNPGVDFIWTATAKGGKLTPYNNTNCTDPDECNWTCDDWTFNGQAHESQIGDPTRTDDGWTAVGYQACDWGQHVLCFEQ